MIRSALLALTTALILVVALGWQNLTSAGWGQFELGELNWDELAAYYDRETVSFPGVVTNEGQISRLVPRMVAANIGMNNSAFPQTQTESARLTVSNRECVSPKANLDKATFFLRSTLSEPLDPIVVYHDRNATLSPDLTVFFQEYGYGYHTLSTNASGERVTIPLIEQPRKVLVTGGSVAFGFLLDDANSFASRLQATDNARQYVTAAVPEGSAEQIICNLTKVMSRYRGQVDELIYFYSEEDLDSGKKFGTPEEVVSWLKSLAQSESIPKVTVIYSPSVYNVVPQFTRYKDYASDRVPNRQAEKDTLRKIVSGAQFGWFDIGEIALEASKAEGNEFSALNNFADEKNLSLQGMNNLVEKFRPAPKKPEVIAVSAGEPTFEGPSPPPAEPDAGLTKRIEKQSAALESIRAAAGRAAKNNRLKREVGDILQKLKDELAAEP